MWYFWGMARNFNPRDTALTRRSARARRKIFGEDIGDARSAAAQPAVHPQRHLMRLNIDTGGFQSRRIIERLAAEEPQRPARELKLPGEKTMLIVCPHCLTTNRVPEARLPGLSNLRELQEGAARGRAGGARRRQLRQGDRENRAAGRRRLLGRMVRALPRDGACSSRRPRRSSRARPCSPRSTATPAPAPRHASRSAASRPCCS